MNYSWSWDVFLQQSPDGRGTFLDTFVSGLGWTLAVAACAWFIACSFGVLIGVMRTLPGRSSRIIGTTWVEVFRAVPLLVQIFLWYFVFPEVLPHDWGMALKRLTPPWGAFLPAVIGLGLFTSARIAEQVRAGIQSQSRGQKAAALAVGLTLGQAYRHVLLPNALRIIVPTLASEATSIIKNSSVALTVGILELTAAARGMQEATFKVFESFAAATCIYFLVNALVMATFRIIERQLAIPGSATARGPV